MNKQQLIVELQTHGLKLVEQEIGAAGRKGGAGPSDHKAVTVDGTTVMVPIYNSPAAQSPYSVGIDKTTNQMLLQFEQEAIGSATPSGRSPRSSFPINQSSTASLRLTAFPTVKLHCYTVETC